jgi:hypothetical protein
MQIYYDIGGYSDMAIGPWQNVRLPFPENFDHPDAQLHHGILEKMAYFFGNVVQRLRLHPLGAAG